MVEIKFCGMTRAQDAREAVSLGARYIGVILASGPRTLTDDDASKVLSAIPTGVARVGVFATSPAREVAARANRLGLDVVQLHGGPDAAAVAEVRHLWSGQVWPVLRLESSQLPRGASDLFDVADAVVLDARVAGKLGGTGITLPWEELRIELTPLRARRAKLVLAGGLRPDNVALAMRTLHPDVVDVSSGVEAEVGVKDPIRMRAFRDAAVAAQA